MTHKPAPARSLNSKRRLIELLLQIVEATKIAFNSLLERSILQNPACSFLHFSRRSEVLPEQRVVDMSYDMINAILSLVPYTYLRH